MDLFGFSDDENSNENGLNKFYQTLEDTSFLPNHSRRFSSKIITSKFYYNKLLYALTLKRQESML